MRALVLAGGQGTRLHPLTPHLPKPFAPVANRPVLTWVLEHLDTAGPDTIGIIVPVEAVERYADAYGGHTPAGTPLAWLPEQRPLGTGGALCAQRAFFDAGPVLVVPADILCPIDLPALLAYHQRHRPAVTVAVMDRDLSRWDGDIVAGTAGTTRYLFKPGPDAPSRRGSTGTWIVDPTLLEIIEPDVFVDMSSEVLPRLPTAGQHLAAFATGGSYLRDVGTFGGLLAANLEIVSGTTPMRCPDATAGIAESATIDPDACLSGPVLIGEHAQVAAGAVITGPAVIGPSVSIGRDAHVEQSVLLAGATVAAGRHLSREVHGDAATAMRLLASGARR